MTSSDLSKTVLLGVGCQKGGTTWLHDYLSASDEADLGFLKEYHVFDALDLEFSKFYIDKIAKNGRKIATDYKAGMPKQANVLRRLQFYSDPETYFDYLQHLVLRDPKVKLTADITPSYAGLSAERLAYIRDGFERRGMKVKVIFLMRDPVERIWSAIRMNYRKHAAEKPGSKLLQTPQETVLLRSHNKPPQAARTRYDLTIANLERAFPAEDIHYEFYERLFRDESVGKICDFLGIAPLPANFDKRLNASPKSSDISEKAVSKVARSYRPVYEMLAARFGKDMLFELWPSMSHL